MHVADQLAASVGNAVSTSGGSKSGLLDLSRPIARELGSRGITPALRLGFAAR